MSIVEEKRKEEPIYERLGPDECFILNKNDEGILVVCNKGGKPKIQRITIPPKSERKTKPKQ
ncbi:MAG: hypothetical protein AB1422_11320 [bacterium]